MIINSLRWRLFPTHFLDAARIVWNVGSTQKYTNMKIKQAQRQHSQENINKNGKQTRQHVMRTGSPTYQLQLILWKRG